MTNHLADAFYNLKLPSEHEDGYPATKISGKSSLYVSKGIPANSDEWYEEAPQIVINTENIEGYSAPSGFDALKNIAIHHRHCDLFEKSGDSHTGIFVIITCLSRRIEVIDAFFNCMSSAIRDLPCPTLHQDVTSMIKSLIELFAFLEKEHVDRNTVLGLWGELFVIAESDCPEKMIKAWHEEPSEQYDFQFRKKRIEVKSTRSQDNRKHRITYNQAHPPAEAEIYIASVLTFRQTEGNTIKELMDEVERLAPNDELKDKIQRVCMKTLKKSYPEVISSKAYAYDRQRANEELLFFNIKDIPKIPKTNIDGVSGIKFDSDLNIIIDKSVDATFIKNWFG